MTDANTKALAEVVSLDYKPLQEAESVAAPSMTECSKSLDDAVDVLCELTGERRACITDDVRFDHLYDTASRILALGARLTAHQAAAAATVVRLMTNEQLDAIITEFSRALDQRGPANMAQVSPRNLAVALAHFEGLKKIGTHAAVELNRVVVDEAIRKVSEMLPPNPLGQFVQPGFLMSDKHCRELHARFAALTAALAKE